MSTFSARIGPVGTTNWLDDDEQRAWRGFLDVHAQLNAVINRQLQSTTGLSLSDYAILVELTSELAPEGSLRMYELGERLQWEKSRVSKQVSRMEVRGLVERRHCADDRRGAFVDLTDEGRAAIEAAAPAHVALVRDLFFDGATREQVVGLGDFTERVLGRLSER
jgi:DNA-binding MarR family transcriptional regulator